MSNDRIFIGPYADSIKRGLEDDKAGRLVDKGSFAQYVYEDKIESLDKPQETLQERIERVEWEIQKYQNELRQLQIEKRELGYVDTYADKRGK